MRGNTETPDSWKFIRITPNDSSLPPHERILCSWYGGFAGSDYWKISSGNQSVIDCDKYLEVPQHSGTVYRLYKGAQHMSSLMWSILNSANKDAADFKIEVIDYKYEQTR